MSKPRGKRAGVIVTVVLVSTAGLLGTVVWTVRAVHSTEVIFREMNQALQAYAQEEDDLPLVPLDANDPNATVRLLLADANSGEFIFAPSATTQPADPNKSEGRKATIVVVPDEPTTQPASDLSEEILKALGEQAGKTPAGAKLTPEEEARLREALEEAAKQLEDLERAVEKSSDSAEQQLDTSGKDSGNDG
ncbi:MAG: hypothetical protein ACLFV7_14105 [Phycisphaerae bacterium]